MSEEKKTIEIPHVIKLVHPVTWGEEVKDSITFVRRLKAKDFKGIKAQDIRFDDMIKLCSRVTGETIAFIEELDAEDMMKAAEVITSFLPRGLPIGENQ